VALRLNASKLTKRGFYTLHWNVLVFASISQAKLTLEIKQIKFLARAAR
jgi:hypothetical protein